MCTTEKIKRLSRMGGTIYNVLECQKCSRVRPTQDDLISGSELEELCKGYNKSLPSCGDSNAKVNNGLHSPRIYKNNQPTRLA